MYQKYKKDKKEKTAKRPNAQSDDTKGQNITPTK